MTTYHQLTQEERYRITALRMCGRSPAEIARQLQRHPSTIGRELRRNVTLGRLTAPPGGLWKAEHAIESPGENDRIDEEECQEPYVRQKRIER
jgi:IS30 family transposase